MASGERRAATDASPRAASPQLNSTLGRKRGGIGGSWVEVLRSSKASTMKAMMEKGIGRAGYSLPMTYIYIGQR